MNFKKAKKIFKRIFTDWDQNIDLLKWIIDLTKGIRRYIWAFLALSAASMAISLGSSVASKYAVDAATGFAGGIFYKYIIVMAATALMSLLLNAVSTMFNSYISEKYSFSLKAILFDKVQRGSWLPLSRFHSGDIVVRISDDINSIASSIITFFPNVIVTGIQLLIVLYILFKYEATLALIGLIIGPLGFFASVIFRKAYTKYEKALRETNSEYHSFFQEVFSNIAITKVFQLEDFNARKFEVIRKKRLRIVLKSSQIKALMSSAVKLIYSTGYLISFSYCAYLLSGNTSYENAGAIVGSTFTYGTMTLFLGLVSRVEGSISAIGSVIPTLYTMFVSAKRIREVADIPKEICEPHDSIPASVGISIKDLTFGYTKEHPVLQHLSLDIQPNQCVGLVGRSGVGKTTLIRLLLALLQPDSGSVTFTDENGKTESASPDARRFISYVPQGNTLLSGTVRDNLLIGKTNADEEEIWKALRIADADEFVRRLPEGLETFLSEKAGGLSEGQAQRIAIARAILRDKPFLIFDEATSALDEETEAKICEAVSREIKQTCLIITHRPSMLRTCDKIIRLEEAGNITHEDSPASSEINR